MPATSMFKPPAAFIRHLGETGFSRMRNVQEFQDFSVYYLDLTRLKILSGPDTPFVTAGRLSGHAMVGDRDIEALLKMLLPMRPSVEGDFVVLVIGGRVEPLPERLRTRLEQHRIAILDGDDISEIESLVASRDQRDARLVSSLVRWLGRRALSPYRHSEPAFGERFFGRTSAIAEALGSHRRGVATFAGCRRIGKTSILREIRRKLLVTFGDRLRTADIYGSEAAYKRKPSNVLVAIVEQLFTGQPDAERLATDPELERKFASTVWLLCDRVPRDAPRLQIEVFVDEVDELIEADEKQEYALLNTLRNAFQGRDHCRLFFAGFRRVMQDMSNHDAVIHNFGPPIPLTGLTRSETALMVEQPLRTLNVETTNDLVSLIYQETRGRPELIQLYCGELVAAADESRHVLSPFELVTRVITSAQFRTKISSTFLSNATDLEQLLCYLLVSRMETKGISIEEYEFSLPDADDLLAQCHLDFGVLEIDRLLNNLRLLSIVEQVPGGQRYRLAVPALANYILAQDVRYLIRKALQRVTIAGAGGRPSLGTNG